ncbi:winged helix-turn-helix domain-containing protein [Lysobacter arvi]|uniref:Winged helix-turn-helix domain-containing protein n=1 Tax=Lysobacter arvi TaxID=3038776 RepID=A0ABU1CGH7_9GAMM|nr:winged helix-turn-helix domain-containing protein [Lysobacter arvi]MDR0184056.1 winged helix-turn-helix domain-containing protein [Lysobacter arvi]
MRLTKYRFGGFELDPAARELRRDGERVALPPKSFDCLAYLIAHRDRAVGRDELIAAVWGRVDISDTVVAQTMLRARKALGDPGDSTQRFVRTVPRFGYHWVEPVDEIATRFAEPIETVAPTPAASALHSPAPARTSFQWRRAAVIACAFGAVAAAVLGAWPWLPLQVRPLSARPAKMAGHESRAVLVLPVRVAASQEDDAWVRLGAMDYLANRLRHGGLRAVPSEQALHLGRPADTARPLDATRARELQRLGDARWVLAPQADRDGRGWRVRLSVFEGERERVVEARGSSVLTATAAAADSWLRRVRPDRVSTDVGPSRLDQRLQQIDAELLAGQLDAARRLMASATPDERADAAVRVREGQIEFRSGHLDKASALFERTLADTTASPEVRAKALMGQGAIEIRRGQPARAQAHYADALDVVQRLAQSDDPTLLGNAYNGLGVALVQQGRMDEAVRDMGLARVAMQRSGNLIEAASVGTNLGLIELQRRHYPQALQEFDRAIAVFERFGVNDYLAAALMAKADAQLDMVQPDAAAASIARAAIEPIGDRQLTARIASITARIALARGRLHEAARQIDRLGVLEVPSDDLTLRELQLRLQLARGATEAATAIALAPVAMTARVPGSLALAASQALLAAGDDATTARWLAYRERIDAAQRGLDWDIAEGLFAQSRARVQAAMSLADAASARVEEGGSPAERVQAGVFKARLLRMQGRPEAAATVLADLDAFATFDYRVAWEALAVYRALHDEAMANDALARVQALRGERDIAQVPAL